MKRTTVPALGAALLLSIAGPGMPSAGPLEVLPAGSFTSMTYNYLTGRAKGVWNDVRDPRVAAINTAAEIADHKSWVRARVLQRIGGLPSAAGSLNVRFAGTLDRDGYKVDKLIYESQANFHVTANLYRPETGTSPFPAVVGIPGHATEGKAYPDYQKVWIALAKRGFVVLAVDPFGHGERFEHWDAANDRPLAGKSGTDEHTIAGTKMYLTGTNPVRWMAFDVMRGIDYLHTRPDVDTDRIAVVGNSGGGAQTNWLAALEPRLAAAGPSCAVYSWETLWRSPGGLNDAEQNLFGFVGDGLSHADLYAPFAPRPLKILAATRDYNPTAGTREAFNELKTHYYDVLGRPNDIAMFEHDDQHGWTKPRREATVEWLEEVLMGTTAGYVEPDPFPTEPPENLRATPNGQVHDTGGPGGATTHSLNYAIAARLHGGRAALATADLRGLVRARLAMGTWSGVPAATAKGTLSGTGYTGYRVDKVTLATEGGITVPALAFVPAGYSGRRPGVLYLNDAGKAADASDTGPIAKVARSGRVVLAIDARQWGESAYPACSGYSCKNHGVAVRALMLGRNLVGMQTRDALRALDYLASRPEVDATNIAVIGKTNAGVPALFTAFLDARVRKVNLTLAPRSYLSVANTQRPGEVMGIVINKVLADFDLPDLEGALGTKVRRTTATNPDYVAWLNS